MLPKPPADHPANPAPKSSAARLDAGGLSIRDERAWQRVSNYCRMHGQFTICAVPIGGAIRYELWRGNVFCASAPDAQTCREIAAAGGAVT